MFGGLTGRYEDFFKKKILSIFLSQTRKVFMTKYKRKINTKQLTMRQWVFFLCTSERVMASSWASQILNSPPRFTWRTIQILDTVLFNRTDTYKEYRIKEVRRREMLQNQAEYTGIAGRPSLQNSKHKRHYSGCFILLCDLHPHITCVVCFLNPLELTARGNVVQYTVVQCYMLQDVKTHAHTHTHTDPHIRKRPGCQTAQ